jgi:hypothetical protein
MQFSYVDLLFNFNVTVHICATAFDFLSGCGKTMSGGSGKFEASIPRSLIAE